MLEKQLINSGMGCGTVKNFNSTILRAMKNDEDMKWYFLTPVKSKDNGSGYKEATVNFAFPIKADRDDISEKEVLLKLEENEIENTECLIKHLKKYFNVVSFTSSTIPFWSTNAVERLQLTDFANVKIHLLNVVVTVKYRESWFKCTCN